MKRKFRLDDPKFAWIFGAIGVIGVALGACQEDATGALECERDTFGNCKRIGVGGGETVGSGGSGGGGGGMELQLPGGAGGGGAGGGGPTPPELPDGGPIPPSAHELNGCSGIDDKSPRIVYMSADDSNSMGSPGHVRELINIGFEPSPSKIRTYEFLNYYRIAYDAPDYNMLSIVPEMERTDEPTIADFQIGVRSYDAQPVRRPMNFTFLVDTSGSMKGPGLERAKAAVEAISSQFVADDIVNFLTTSTTLAQLDGHRVVGPTDPMLADVLANLTAGGTSNLNASLAQAYMIADKYKDRDVNIMNRVILISDGGTSVGTTAAEIIAKHSADADRKDIYLVGIGTGPALSYNDKLMNEVTDAGRGAYVYLDSVEEAQKILAARFDETMDIAARAVQVELTLPWYFNVEGKSIDGPVSPTPVEPQHLAPNDAMVFFLQTKACDPSVYDLDDNVRIRVSWKEPLTYVSRVTDLNVPLKSFIGKDLTRVAKGRAIVAFAEALKACGFDKKGEYLCKTETERKEVTKMKLIEARKLAEKVPADAEITEIIGLIDKHPLMQ